MNYRSTSRSANQNNARRLLTTLAALCLPILAAMFVSGGLFRAGSLPAGDAHNATSVHAACGAHGSLSTTGGNNPTNNVSISITDSSFNPSSVTVSPGTQVTWTNNGTRRHRVRDVDHNFFDSDDLEPGESFSYTFS